MEAEKGDALTGSVSVSIIVIHSLVVGEMEAGREGCRAAHSKVMTANSFIFLSEYQEEQWVGSRIRIEVCSVCLLPLSHTAPFPPTQPPSSTQPLPSHTAPFSLLPWQISGFHSNPLRFSIFCTKSNSVYYRREWTLRNSPPLPYH